MKFTAHCALAVAILWTIASGSHAESIITAVEPTSNFRHGSSYGGRYAAGLRDSYRHVQEHFLLESRGVANRLEWRFTPNSQSSTTLDIESDIFSSFVAEHERYQCDREGNCDWILYPDHYEHTEMRAKIHLEVPEPLRVRVTVDAESLEGTPLFSMHYFDRITTYATDPHAGELLSLTTMIPDASTDNPLDVHDFVDQFWIAPGSHTIELEMMSGFAERGHLYDASARVSFTFSTVPEPTMAPLLFACLAPFGLRRVRGRFFRAAVSHLFLTR